MSTSRAHLPRMNAADLAALLQERVTYDGETGALYRKAGFKGLPAGQRLGSPDSSGKRQATFAGKRYRVDALIWVLETGRLPAGILSHKNYDNLDDRFENLREGIKRERSDAVSAAEARATAFAARARSRFPTHDLAEVAYKNRLSPVRIGCPTHGLFLRKPERYLESPHGCPRCGIEQHALSKTKSQEERQDTERRYRRANRARYTAAGKRFYQRNIRTNPGYIVALACRNLLARVLHDTRQAKANRTAKMLGYSFVEFKAHIEQQFEPWMSWANHGEWHVDHIFPVSRFLRMGITDVKVINALSNLRPLAKQANLMKRDKLVEVDLLTRAVGTSVAGKISGSCSGVRP